MTSSREIRAAFTRFFEAQGHTKVPSGPLVPPNDDSLMFANAGMVQFKDVFTGREERPYTRATSSQKCIRISGKHNDLENVGVTARHHTFFEMLGNFSFGDYFKRDAIQFAWSFFVDELKLDPERMVVTVFGGEEGYGGPDTDAEEIWREISGLDDSRIIRCGAADNFWQMGETGPCGPCSEIHYSLGTETADPSTFGEEPTPDGRGWFELWNLVFMQFDRQADGSMPELPVPCVDTGAGLERIAVVMQDQLSNYDTDLLRPIVELAAELSGKAYGKSQSPDDVSMRVIADHARTTAFLISEGIFPDKGKTEYVLRRVMRRAIRHGHRLGIEEPFLHLCAKRVIDLMGDDYPQLREREQLIAEIAEAEEVRFRGTMARGLTLIDENQDWEVEEGKRRLPGAVAFKLYDTYGFPLDLQEVIGAERGFGIDSAGFDAAMAEARERSQGSKLGQAAVSDVYFKIAAELDAPPRFVGYETQEATATVVALVVDGERVDSASQGTRVEVLTDTTPFYGEKGGQVGDRGELLGDGVSVAVDASLIPTGDLIVHHGEIQEGTLKVGDGVRLKVDDASRMSTRRNHSATHLLHWALRTVLGDTVTQKGSLVGPDRLRFDFSATAPLTEDEIRRVEDLVNDAILANTEVSTEVLPMDEAKARGAIGIFEEKYGDVVRMLRIGPSLELCGGTHAFRTGDIGAFTILGEQGLAAGVRRIEAATGTRTLAHMRDAIATLSKSAGLLKANVTELPERVAKVLDRSKELQREIERLQKELVSGGGSGNDLAASARKVDGVHWLGTTVPIGDGKALREMADQLRDSLAPAVVLLGAATKDGKAMLVCSVSKEITDRFRAGDIVKNAATIVGGRGGGRPDFAQAGGSDPTKLEEAVQSIYPAAP